jgi:UDP-glucose 4-epimerase
MARILITGGAGYVGSHCAKALAAAGHQGVVFDNFVFGHREFVRWGPLIEGDVRDGAALDAVFSSHRFDAVMHFAALASVRRITGREIVAPRKRAIADARSRGEVSTSNNDYSGHAIYI